MRSLIAFMKKDFLEQLRSGRLMILGLIFAVLGIMNPAVAKLTPWLLEMMADTLAESGMTVTEVTVSAMDSWVQFYKNLPIGLIAFVLMQSSILTKEYSSGTLIMSLTRGLERFKVVLSKSIVLALLWTVYYWLCFAITYGYNAYFWDNSIAKSLGFSAVCWWLFGSFVLSLCILFSSLARSATDVLLGTGGVVLASYLMGLIPKISKYMPTALAEGNPLIYGIKDTSAYFAAVIITALVSLACFAASIPVFNKKLL